MNSFVSRISGDIAILGTRREWRLIAESVEALSNYKHEDEDLEELKIWFKEILSQDLPVEPENSSEIVP